MSVAAKDLEALLRASYIDLTTTGRKTGEPRTVELSFAVKGTEVLCLAGDSGRVHWYQNLLREPKVAIRVGGVTLKGRAVKRPSHPKKLAREILLLLRDKYGSAYVRDRYQGGNRVPVRIKILGRQPNNT